MRLHINLDDALVRAVDDVAGLRGRSRFIREAVEREVKARRSREALLRAAGAAPEFGSHLGPDWIREGRRRSTEESNRRLRERRRPPE